jgi:uncharacterized membrane protein
MNIGARVGSVAFVRRPPYNRHPLTPTFALALATLAALVLVLFAVDAIGYAYRRIGIGQGALLALIWISLAGGFVNIPVARLRGRETIDIGELRVFGVRYRVPLVRRQPATIVAVNLGGAVIPTGLSLYLLAKDGIWSQAAIAVPIVAVLVYAFARPVRGLGIAVPALVPPALAAGTALLVSTTAPAAVAYVAGTLGTLIGADLLNLPRLRNLGAGVASIGGAGTFDGVFLSGIIAVLLVGLR